MVRWGCVTYVGGGGGRLCRGIGLWELEGLRGGTDSGWRFEVGLRPVPAFELRERPASWPCGN